ncbi:Poly-gamma-glutamate capsule biosynthesis protein CapA [uncultured virus]|nr:Poly-gamma-glutamate capsule biosynthesis protein CapA [uncultured virus]
MLRIALVGDCMLGRGLNNVLRRDGPQSPWGDDLLPTMRAASVLAGNLETSITARGVPFPHKAFRFRLDPSLSDTLALAGFDFLNLANNHALDYGVQGLVDTRDELKRLGIAHAGAGLDLSEASEADYLDVPSGSEWIRVGFLGAADHPAEWRAGPQLPGTFFVDVERGEWSALLEAVRRTRARCDVLVVYLHVGRNYVSGFRPYDTVLRLGRELVDAGADVVANSSAHHVLPFERHGDGLVLHGLGDFVDDYAVDPAYRNDLGVLALVDLQVSPRSATRRRVRARHLELVPTKIVDMRVRRAVGDDALWVLDRVVSLPPHDGVSFG